MSENNITAETDIETRKKRKYGAILLFSIAEGYEEIENNDSFLDAVFAKDGKSTGYIYEFSRTPEEMLLCIENAKQRVDYIYIMTDDSSKYRELLKSLPEFCGIFCDSNAYGMGMVTQILRPAELIKK